MKEQDDIRKELEQLSPFLREMKDRKEGFKAPVGYFKELPDEVWQRLKPVAPAQPSWQERLDAFLVSLWQPRFALAFASGALLVVAAWWLLQRNDAAPATPQIAAVQLSDITEEDLLTYVTQHIADFDNQLILESHGFDQQETAPKPIPKLLPKPTAEEAEEYLDEMIEDIDVEDLEALL